MCRGGGNNVAGNGNVFTVNLDGAGLGRIAGNIQRTGVGDRAAFQEDATTLLANALSFNGAAVDDAGCQLVGGACREDD